jgi:hypothetical protein
MKKQISEWEEEFDIRYKYGGLYTRYAIPHGIEYSDSRDVVKEFIREIVATHHTKLVEEIKKEVEEMMKKSKVYNHFFDGSCCYNNNENGKGHLECRYPYNPGRDNPSGTQCLKLKEEHFDILSLPSLQLPLSEGNKEKV